MAKLTLSVDAQVVAQARTYARARGTSISRIVESVLSLLSTDQRSPVSSPPVLSRLRGSMKRGSRADYQRYLDRKYR